MLWAALVAVGVAMVSMAVLAARLTRKPPADLQDDWEAEGDPNDPWAAWRPRPFEEHDRRPRPRVWPLLAALTGLVLVGSGIAGARQSLAPARTEVLAVGDSSPAPFVVEVKVTPSPTPVPTPRPPTAQPIVTAKPQVAAPQPTGTPSGSGAPTGPGPAISGSATCQGGKLRLSYTITAQGSNLAWEGVYADGKSVRGGPINGTSRSGTYEQAATSGDHNLEVSAQDRTGKTNRKQWQARCP
jgi:hypothetical protein